MRAGRTSSHHIFFNILKQILRRTHPASTFGAVGWVDFTSSWNCGLGADSLGAWRIGIWQPSCDCASPLGVSSCVIGAVESPKARVLATHLLSHFRFRIFHREPKTNFSTVKFGPSVWGHVLVWCSRGMLPSCTTVVEIRLQVGSAYRLVCQRVKCWRS